MLDLLEACDFAKNLAVKVGQNLIRHQSKVTIIYFKDLQDVQTSADLKAETIFIQAIKEKYPSHSIYTEESGEDSQNSVYKWIIDPLDGTKEYLRHIPQYNVSFALEYQQQPVLSVVYRPTSKQLYWAILNQGAFYNGTQVFCSKETNLAKAFIYAYLPGSKTSSTYAYKSWQKLYRLSREVYRLRGMAEEAAALCWLGSGGIDACINFGPQSKWHDIIPGLFFAKEAGAVISDIFGNTVIAHHLPNGFVVSNPNLHQSIIDIINQK
jgi:myo-inositol-1(or 4)-monophosphatase